MTSERLTCQVPVGLVFLFIGDDLRKMKKEIIFTTHARQRIVERGATEADVIEAINTGLKETAQRGLFQYRLNLEFNREWAGKSYRIQQVAPVIAEEEERVVVITVYVFYF